MRDSHSFILIAAVYSIPATIASVTGHPVMFYLFMVQSVLFGAAAIFAEFKGSK